MRSDLKNISPFSRCSFNTILIGCQNFVKHPLCNRTTVVTGPICTFLGKLGSSVVAGCDIWCGVTPNVTLDSLVVRENCALRSFFK